MYYADEYGMLIAPIQTENFLSLPQLQFINSNDTLKKAVAELLFFLKEKNTSISLNMISHIRVSDEKGIEIPYPQMDVHIDSKDAVAPKK